MLILKATQVETCPVLRKNIFDEILLPGLSFQGKLFFRVAQYAQPLDSQAKQAARRLVAQGQSHFSVLLVSAKDQITVWQEDPELILCSAERARFKRIQQIDLEQIVVKIHGINGLEMRSCLKGLRRQNSCFLAKEIVEWLSKVYQLTDDDSIRLAQRMINEKVIYNLEHHKNFKSNRDFYRFYDDEL